MIKLSLKKIKQIQLEILSEFTKFCDKNNIEYFLIYGTLLGAVRHQGYIPWDDDLDIAIKRDDYLRVIKEFNNYSKEYKFISYEVDKKFPYTFGKIMKNNTIILEDCGYKYSGLGINIDVFPIDNIFESEKLRKKTMKRITFYRKALEIKGITFKKSKSSFKEAFKSRLAKLCLLVLSVKSIVKKIIFLATLANKEESSLRGITVWGYGEKEVMPSEYYEKSTKLIFEGKEYKVPLKYHEVLTQIYKDYMVLPKEEDRITHHAYDSYIVNGEKKYE